MLVQVEGSAGLAFPESEDLGALRVQRTLRHQRRDVDARHEIRVELHQRIRPEGTGSELLLHVLPDVPITDMDERGHVGLVLADHFIAEIEDVQENSIHSGSGAGPVKALIMPHRAASRVQS
ncbi:hypothetical protein [Deinococcus sp. RIT780]|uniref:hypothetical protein n=1 Tax=Deinococcus sp. RIT780 TaxID=2870472 RepID=UPI001C897ABE|nr:hypothetical protein [Deinococcus sp. RIT780]MBX8464814.1 hypothetical protein [Deinococcus sp. RIT780]